MTYQIIYSSESATPMQQDDLEELLEQAQTHNAPRGITGALVYAEGLFLQILEGDRVELQDLMARIVRDVRHETVTVLREGEVPRAVFAGWTMAYVGATAEQVAKWAGFGTTTQTAQSLAEFGQDAQRTAQFVQRILSVLALDGTQSKAV